jgi:hypothetical protein
MVHASRAALLVSLLALPALAHDVITTKLTYSKEIVRIFLKHCAGCHRDGGAAPFSLTTYTAARPWATAIKEEVLARRMPPWGAVKGFGEFANDRGLAQEEIHLIADWVEGGAPEGDAAFVPHYPKLASPAPESAPAGRRIVDRALLKQPLTLYGLFPEASPPDNTKLVVRLPSGELQPLIWFYGLKPKFLHPFWLASPLRLPAGTELRATNETPIRLLLRPPAASSSPAARAAARRN